MDLFKLPENISHLSPLRSDPFGNNLLIKRFLISTVGMLTYPRFALVNKLDIQGTEHLKGLPNRNVLFLSNHQTYFADVIAFYHIFCSVKWGFQNTIENPIYLLMPRVNSYYVAAEETMKDSGLIPRIFSMAGAVTVKRSWRAKGSNVQRGLDANANEKIAKALQTGWVVSFPQGTTSPYAPVRKGTAHIIQECNPIVVPVVINGFRRAFDKKGFFFKKRGVTLSVRFKPAMHFDPNLPIDDLIEQVRAAIEQDVDLPHLQRPSAE